MASTIAFITSIPKMRLKFSDIARITSIFGISASMLIKFSWSQFQFSSVSSYLNLWTNLWSRKFRFLGTIPPPLSPPGLAGSKMGRIGFESVWKLQITFLIPSENIYDVVCIFYVLSAVFYRPSYMLVRHGPSVKRCGTR